MKEPLRIAQIMGKWLGGGVESVVMNYYRNIDRTSVQFDFICDSDSTDIPYEEIKNLGGRVFVVPPYQKILPYRNALIKLFRENGYTVVHSHLNTLSVFPLSAAKKAGVKIRIAHSHSTTSRKEFKRNIAKHILRPWTNIFATHYFCCSEKAGRWQFGNKAYNKGNVFLLNNAIDLEKFRFNKDSSVLKRKELGISESTFVMGHMGRFMAQKNHEFLINVFNEVNKKNPDSILLLAGQGPLVEDIKEKVMSLGLQNKVKFLGQRKDASELYQAMDVFVLPSLYEGLPVVLVEAQGAGLKCFTSDKVSYESKISDDLNFIPLENSKLWAEEILKVKGMERKDNFTVCTQNGYNIKENASKLLLKYKDFSENV
ncbi:MAG: glycosyltransferase family 1 protein [Treponema sp.]|nr:glycosyltransferase family 1 protein [Treponema sp.]